MMNNSEIAGELDTPGPGLLSRINCESDKVTHDFSFNMSASEAAVAFHPQKLRNPVVSGSISFLSLGGK